MNNTKKENITIGIPRAISYYNNYPFYYGFFKALGVEIILSDKTTTAIVNSGARQVVSDTCLPVKVFVGHVINLIEKGCKNIFVPSLQSVGHKINNCSKIRALPEIIRNVIDTPINLIEPTLDKTEDIGIKDFCIETAKQLGITDIDLIHSAMQNGWNIYDNFIEMTKNGVSHQEAIKNAISGNFVKKNVEIVRPLSVVVMAHGYNLFDEHVSLRLIKKLEKMDVKVYTSLNVSREDSINSIHKMDEIQYWANELDLTGVAAYYMLNNKIDGIIALSAFGCGPDSLMVDEIQYHATEMGMPIIHLNIDEHTGEAGFVTRLEAFIDMLARKKRKDLEKQNKTISQFDINKKHNKHGEKKEVLTDSLA